MFTIFSHPLYLCYQTPVCSKATVFFILATILTFVPPLLITYRSQGENETFLSSKHRSYGSVMGQTKWVALLQRQIIIVWDIPELCMEKISLNGLYLKTSIINHCCGHISLSKIYCFRVLAKSGHLRRAAWHSLLAPADHDHGNRQVLLVKKFILHSLSLNV